MTISRIYSPINAAFASGIFFKFAYCVVFFGLLASARAQEPGSQPSTEQPKTADSDTVKKDTTSSEAAETQTANAKADIVQGHSFHGEAFNEGPRQAAYLMHGMPSISFPASTGNELSQQFINQGVAQLHGFWYYEAERSFRQAAKLDPECAIAYLGMAMANVENLKRARSFIDQANTHKSKASRREQLYIEAYEKFCRDTEGDDKKKIPAKTRAQRYTEGLEDIVLEFPDDIEAKAFLCGQLWANERSELPIIGHSAINALLQEIFDVNPMHPAHHYRIHLWDRKKAEQALASAARCGPCSPGIAHMWHMPGHIYSKLHRYHDACWQQEASARVDHAHMIRDRVMPDQIHNFAHNNEWLIRNMIKVGRLHDAVSLAKNMIELPRHTKYNSLKKSGSSKYGRERLFQTLYAYEMWDDIVELSQSAYLPDVADDEDLHLQWSRYVGVAQAMGRGVEAARPIMEELNQRLETVKQSLLELDAADKAAETEKAKNEGTDKSQPESTPPKPDSPKITQASPDGSDKNASTKDVAADDSKTATSVAPESKPSEVAAATAEVVAPKEAAAVGTEPEAKPTGGNCEAEPDAADKKNKEPAADKKKRDDQRKKLVESQKKIEKVVHSISAAQCAVQQRWFEALELASKGEDLDALTCQWQMAAGNYEKAIALARKKVADAPGEILPLALVSWIEFQHGGSEAAKESFEKVRALSSNADIESPPLHRLSWLANALKLEPNWRIPAKPADDIGQRPELDSLGPYRWHPYDIPEFTVKDLQNDDVSIRNIDRPTLVIFYLGFGCLHCVEQLKAFSPRAGEINQAGIDLMAISLESPQQMSTAIKNYDKPIEIPLHTDSQLEAFKAMRCFDDFEGQPLHGLFLVKPNGDGKTAQVLWQDINFEPFMDVDFVLQESQRLLKLSK